MLSKPSYLNIKISNNQDNLLQDEFEYFDFN